MLSECSSLVRLGYARDAASASVVGMVDRFPMMLSFEAASVGRPIALGPLERVHTGFRSGRLTSSNVATWVLSNQDSNVAPQTLQETWPVCGTKNFVSVRSYSARNRNGRLPPFSKYAPSASRFKPDCSPQ